MKNKIFLALTLLVLSAPEAFASRARNLVLFTGDGGFFLDGSSGSLSYDGCYNAFYNPSYINDCRNQGTIEKFNGVSGPQGGFISSFLNYTFGAYFNRLGGVTGVYTNRNVMKPIEFFLGSDMGVKWGLNIGWAQFGKVDQDLTIRAGAQISDFEPFVSAKALSTRNTGADKRNHHFGGGLRYKWGEWTPYLGARYDLTDDGSTGKSITYGLGISRMSKAAEGVNVIYSLGYWAKKINDAAADTVVPFEFGVEGEASSWLTLRAGYAFRNTSTGRIGASFHAGKQLDIDLAFGSSSGTENLDGSTLDLANGLISAASLSYRF